MQNNIPKNIEVKVEKKKIEKKKIEKKKIEKKKIEKNLKNYKKAKKSRYRVPRKEQNIKINQEIDQKEIDKKVESIYNNIKLSEEYKNFFNFSLKDYKKKIKETLQLIGNSRNYNKNIIDIKKYRMHLLSILSDKEYRKYTMKNLEDIKKIFEQRGQDNKKIKKLVKFKVFNPIEKRLLLLDDFENTNIEIDDIDFVKKCYEIRHLGPMKFTIFNINNMCNVFNSYYLSLFNLEKLLEFHLTNIFPFPNIIYLNLEKSNIKDPYCFYYLETITDEYRNWRMDCRLLEISTNICNDLLKYCVSIYRNIYHKIYNDNDYRNNYTEISQIFEIEGEQLIKNIFMLSNKSYITTVLQKIIIKHSTYTPTTKDRFNLYSDDSLNKKEFKEIMKNDFQQEICNNLKQLFDNINDLQIVELYKNIDLNT